MNEILLLVTSFGSVGLILVSWQLGKERMYSAIIIFLILITTVGGKIVDFFGYETNTGNIFYASVFLTTYFLIERFGKREGMRSIWIGTIGVTFFLILAKITVAIQGSTETSSINQGLRMAFDPATRVASASLFAYIISQNINVYVYAKLKEKWNGTKLWLRANITNALAQIVDSSVFFLIAFWQVVPPANIGEIILISLVVKIVFMICASPILYLNKVEYDTEGEYNTITVS